MTSASIAASLPPGLRHYKTSPEFTAMTVPQSLLSAHRTKAGVWGLLRVTQGRLRYCIDAVPPKALVIEQGSTAVIDPEALHHVELLDAETRFLIEFHRRAEAK
ncbi:conserved protein of unknown function [Hyphomicrobium sp. 1Nfss2.1]|uniref:DUF1971 domain-containing protein n=1 Tax=Hyphomicrobium sp. 1Nfss2.1 TaxID=3413936 RepID=UPI003C7CBD45